MSDNGKSLSKDQVRALAAYSDQRDNPVPQLDSNNSLKGGQVLSASAYEDHAGQPRQKALVDYGIAGVKSFDASDHELAVAAGEVEPTLEMLSLSQLRQIASELDVSVGEGRPNPVKVIVAIKAKLEADAVAGLEDETEGLTRSEVINAFGEKVGRILIDAGYASLSAVGEASDKELLDIDGIGKATVKAIRAVD